MPYITQNHRKEFQPAITELTSKLDSLGQSNLAGNLNYIFSCLISNQLHPLSYAKINEMIGVLECCKQELYIKIATPYEKKKEELNGKVYC